MPLLRYYEYSQGVQIHVASYPPVFEGEGKQPFNLTAAGSLATAQFMAMEGATFVLVPTCTSSAENRVKAGIPADAKLVRCALFPVFVHMHACSSSLLSSHLDF